MKALASPRSSLRAAALVPALLLLALLLSAWFCYRPGFSGLMLLDDEVQLPPIFAAIDTSTWRTHAPDFLFSSTGPGGRPVAMASLIASVAAHGGDVPALKRENVLLHLLCGVLVFAWFRQLQRIAARRCDDDVPGPWLPLLGAGIWLLHPLMVSTVLYTIQRMTILSALFTLAGLIAYTAGREAQVQGAARRGLVLMASCMLLCLPLAVLAKENGVLLLPLCAALELTVLRGLGSPAQRRALRGFYALTLVLPLVLAATVLLPGVAHWLLSGYLTREFTLAERLLTEARVMVFYLSEWFLPTPARLSFYHDDFAISHGWRPWTTAPAVALLAGIALGAWQLRVRAPLVAFGLMFFLVGHSLESSVVPLELVFEHRNYLPDVGLALAVVMLPWQRWLRNELGLPAVRAGICVLVLASLAMLTLQRSHAWSSADVLFPSLFELNPDSPRLSALFARNYANGGQFDVAQRILARQDTLGARLQMLDLDCVSRHDFDATRLDDAVSGMRGVVGTYETQQLVYLANDVLEQRCGLPIPWGLAMLDRALSLPITQAASRQLLWFYRGHLEHARGRFDEAQRDLEYAAAAEADNPLPLLLAGSWALDRGDATLARRRFADAQRVTGVHRTEYDALYQELGGRLRTAK